MCEIHPHAAAIFTHNKCWERPTKGWRHVTFPRHVTRTSAETIARDDGEEAHQALFCTWLVCFVSGFFFFFSKFIYLFGNKFCDSR